MLGSFYQTSVAGSSDCNDACVPLAKVTFTNQGVAKLTETILKDQFEEMRLRIIRESGFERIAIRPNCDTFKQKNPNSRAECFALEEFLSISKDGIDLEKTGRPIEADLELSMRDIALRMEQKVSCQNFECRVQLSIPKLELNSNLRNFRYSDGGDLIASRVPTTIRLNDIVYELPIKLDPKTGNLNELGSTDPSLHVTQLRGQGPPISIDLVKPSSSPKNREIYAKYLSAEVEKLRQEMASPNWVDNQIFFTRNTFIRQKVESDLKKLVQNNERRLCDESETDNEKKYRCNKALLDQEMALKKAAEQEWESKQLEKEWRAKLQNAKIPEDMSRESIIDFVHRPPEGFRGVDFATIQNISAGKTIAELQGFKDVDVGSVFLGLSQIIPKAVPEAIRSFLSEQSNLHVKPMVASEVNREISNATQYWNQIAQIPSLNLQNLERQERLQRERAKVDAELGKSGISDSLRNSLLEKRSNLDQQLKQLEAIMEKDWVKVDTQVLIDTVNSNSKFLKGRILKPGAQCVIPPEADDDKDDDFDLSTELTTRTLKEYFDSMSGEGKLKVCIGSDDPECGGGTKVDIDEKPTISCVDGKVRLQFSSRIMNLLGADTSIDANIANCNGSPCINLVDSKSKLKCGFLNFFLGGLLDRSVKSALKDANRYPLPVPRARLKDVKINPKNCNTNLKWDFE